MNRFFKCAFILAMAALFGLATNAVQAQTTIYYDSFNRGTVDSPLNLDGSIPEVNYYGSTWSAYVDGTTPANSVTTNGTSAHVTAHQTNAYLPFIPEAGNLYVLSADLSSPDTYPSDTRSALGFVTNATTTGDYPFIGANNNQAVWFQRGPRTDNSDQVYFNGYTMQTTDTSPAPPVSTNYSIVLDTSGFVWTYEFLRNGISLGTMTSNPLSLNYVGFGVWGNTMDVSNFSLTGEFVTNLGYTWTGSVPANPNFSLQNWVDDSSNPASPVSGELTHLVFSGTAGNGVALNNDIANLITADNYYSNNHAIVFDATAPAYTIGGNAITVKGTIVNNSTNDQTFNTPLLGSAVVIQGDSTKSTIFTGGATVSALQVGGLDNTTGKLVLQGGSVGNPMNYTLTAGPVRVGGNAGNAVDASGTLTMKEYSLLSLSVDDVTVGWGATCSGLLEMKDNSTITLTNGKWMYFGIAGQGALTLSDYATVNMTNGDLRFAQNSGSSSLAMSGNTTINSTGYTMYIGTDGSGNATADLSGYATINKLTGDIRIGNGGTTAVMTMTNNATLSHTGGNWFMVGVTGGNGTLTMSGNSVVNKPQSDLVIGMDDGSTGKLVLNENASFLYSGGDWTNIGFGNGTTGTLEVHDNATFTTSSGALLVGRDGGDGTVTLDGVNPVIFNYFANIIGDNGNYGSDRSTTGTMTLANTVSTIFGNGSIALGNHPGATGTLDITDGASLEHMNVGEIQIGVSGTGTMKVHGGTAAVHPVVINRSSMRVGHVDERSNPPGIGTLEISGYAQFIELGNDQHAVSVATFGATGTMTVADHATYTQPDGNFWLTWGGGGTGTLNLKGGVFESRNIISDAGTAAINWQGGTYKLAPTGDNSPFFTWNGGTETIKVGKGANGFGAIVDSSNKDFQIGLDFQHDDSVTGLDGGFTKIGPNTLTLNGNLSYTGNTNVNEGTLTVKNLSTPDATVFVATGATLNAISIVADTLTIGGDQVVIDPVPAMQAVPEPSTLVLSILAVLGLAGMAWRKR